MLHSILVSLALAIGLTSAVPHGHHEHHEHKHEHHSHHAHYVPHPTGLIPRQANNISSTNLLVAGAGQIRGFTYDGGFFIPTATANVSEPGKVASWLIFRKPNFLYAVDENSASLRLFNYEPKSGTLSNEIASFNGSMGVVHLAFNADKTMLIGSSYTQGTVDVWDASSPDGHLKLNKQIVLKGVPGPKPSQLQHRAHQAVLDPSGRFFLVNDLGGDALHIVDTSANYSVVNSVPVTPAGSGPRHGAFISVPGTPRATHYVVACELSNTLQLFTVSYDNNTLSLTGTHTLPSYGDGYGPANTTSAAAGELIINRSGPAHIYVSNRNTGNHTDFVARFALESKSKNDTTAQLVYKGFVPSGGIAPRSMAFSKEDKQGTLFFANMNGDNGLASVRRNPDTGKMDSATMLNMSNQVFAPGQPSNAGFGPQFVLAF